MGRLKRKSGKKILPYVLRKRLGNDRQQILQGRKNNCGEAGIGVKKKVRQK
jgi:hypothetical protein